MKKTPILKKSDHSAPAFVVGKGGKLSVRPGVKVPAKTAKLVALPKKLIPGCDYGITLVKGEFKASRLPSLPSAEMLGGFHVGLDGVIAPHSIWDIEYRPSCPDPRGMVRIPGAGWVDIYLLNTEPQINGTSAAGKTIADGLSHVSMPDGETKPLTWWNAVTVLARYGKQLLSRPLFETAMQGVEEGKILGRDPETTGHSPGLKSIYGIEQATGCMWTWSSDIYNQNAPWMYILGGDWNSGAAGPRQSYYSYPGYYWTSIGARGRCDHLSPVLSEAKA